MDREGAAAADALTRYEAMASSLPASSFQGFGSALFRSHGGFWYPAHQMGPSLAVRDTFVARPTDVLIATLPKSGATWLKALVFAIVARDQQHAPGDDDRGQQQHPLLGSSPHDLVPFLHHEHR